MNNYTFFDRDISWLSFNERVLMEAASKHVPLIERIKFLSIYSSNLDEFYRVRVSALSALQSIKQKQLENNAENILQGVKNIVGKQQELFGNIITELLPALKDRGICFIYKESIPTLIIPQFKAYFFSHILAFLQPVYLTSKTNFFPENNKLYKVVVLQKSNDEEELVIVNIPSDKLPRFQTIHADGKQYIVFIDDIVKEFLPLLFKDATVVGSYNFKITRDAELNLEDEYEEDIAEKIEIQINKRDFGFATRFLHEPAILLRVLHTLIKQFNLTNASMVAGGTYHNLKDLASFPVSNTELEYVKWPALQQKVNTVDCLFDEIENKDIILHAPWQSYDTILRFFNEAANDSTVEEIYVTLYRVANDSKIVNALISAAKNGKKVYVLVELKARFDEANNIKWARQMKAAGVKIIYSVVSLKVHAKIALVKKKKENRDFYLGLLATGNLNESTAKFYTDHILLTANPQMLREMELLFIFLKKRSKTITTDIIQFEHLLVAQFNLQEKFISLIDTEISNAKRGLPSGITIKLNNLEERVLISKLYEASNAGVIIQLIVRGICCLIPSIIGQSANINITRIVDRYLEHGRVFIFNNNNNPAVYMGSADWMNRNIYRRIEVCFPVLDNDVKNEILSIINLQLKDNVQAVQVNSNMQKIPIETNGEAIQSQLAIYEFLKHKAQ